MLRSKGFIPMQETILFTLVLTANFQSVAIRVRVALYIDSEKRNIL
jgi:hypothetical protein